MKLQSLYIPIVLLLLLAITSCRGDKPKRMPDTLPDVHGYISQIKRTTQKQDKYKATIMVKAIEGVDVKYPVASIQLDKETLIESQTGEHLKLELLREGHEIKAWFDGEVLESYPVQGYVKAIRVELH
jgi:hypothetical protein